MKRNYRRRRLIQPEHDQQMESADLAYELERYFEKHGSLSSSSSSSSSVQAASSQEPIDCDSFGNDDFDPTNHVRSEQSLEADNYSNEFQDNDQEEEVQFEMVLNLF